MKVLCSIFLILPSLVLGQIVQKGEAEDDAVQKLGEPSLTRKTEGGALYEFFPIGDRPGIRLVCEGGKVRELNWRFPKSPLVIHGGRSILVPHAAAVKWAELGVSTWLEEVEFGIPWRELKDEERQILLKAIRKTSDTLGRSDRLVSREHVFIQYLQAQNPKVRKFIDRQFVGDRMDIIQFITVSSEVIINLK